MTAKEMFEELGFKAEYKYDNLIIYSYIKDNFSFIITFYNMSYLNKALIEKLSKGINEIKEANLLSDKLEKAFIKQIDELMGQVKKGYKKINLKELGWL